MQLDLQPSQQCHNDMHVCIDIAIGYKISVLRNLLAHDCVQILMCMHAKLCALLVVVRHIHNSVCALM